MRSVLPISVILVLALLPDAVQARDLIFGKSKIVVIDRGKTKQVKGHCCVGRFDGVFAVQGR